MVLGDPGFEEKPSTNRAASSSVSCMRGTKPPPLAARSTAAPLRRKARAEEVSTAGGLQTPSASSAHWAQP